VRFIRAVALGSFVMTRFEKLRAIHRNNTGTKTTKFINTTKKLMEGIREIKKRARPVRIRRVKRPDTVWASWSDPGLLNARAADRLNSVE